MGQAASGMCAGGEKEETHELPNYPQNANQTINSAPERRPNLMIATPGGVQPASPANAPQNQDQVNDESSSPVASISPGDKIFSQPNSPPRTTLPQNPQTPQLGGIDTALASS